MDKKFMYLPNDDMMIIDTYDNSFPRILKLKKLKIKTSFVSPDWQTKVIGTNFVILISISVENCLFGTGKYIREVHKFIVHYLF